MKKIRKDKRFARDENDRGDLTWIISVADDEPVIIDVFDYEAQDYIAAKNKHGNVKTFSTPDEARIWALKHPDRLKR